MKCPEQANPWRPKVEEGVFRFGGERNAEGLLTVYGVLFREDENMLGQDGGDGCRTPKISRTTELYNLK